MTTLTLVLLPVGAQAGPTVHSAAQPDFRDPLSRARPADAPTDPAIVPTRERGSDSIPVSLESEIGSLSNVEANSEDGLEEAQTDDVAQAVRDEFLGQEPSGANEDARTSLDSVVDRPDGSSANILQALINSVPGESTGGSPERTGQNSGGNNSTSSLLDATLNNLVMTILNPDLKTEGMVTFSIAGFGEFALLLLQESGGIFLVDMESGTAVKFSEAGGSQISGPLARDTRASLQQDRGPSNALQRVLEFLERNVLPIVSSPITIATVMLFGIIWVVWRLSARE